MKQFLVLSHGRIVFGPFNTLGKARGVAYHHAIDNPGEPFEVWEWSPYHKTMTQTKHSYMGQVTLPSSLGGLVQSHDDCLRG